jgi:hypothetical protein
MQLHFLLFEVARRPFFQLFVVPVSVQETYSEIPERSFSRGSLI